jgi:hypothetical protein
VPGSEQLQRSFRHQALSMQSIHMHERVCFFADDTRGIDQ